jgi:E3 ubiquitin-protein ligase HECTD4
MFQVENGSETYLSWENRKQYTDLIRHFRFREMACENRMLNIRAGLATIAPVNVLTHLFTAEEAELKICGLAKIEVEILKKYTIYQVGLNQTDQHIQV